MKDSLSSRQDISSSVYVISGNNESMKKQINALLQKNSLHSITKEMASNWTGEGAPFVGRIIDVAFEHAQAVLVLLSGDEQVRLRQSHWKQHEHSYERDFAPQATLEQIFEAGYAFGKLPERTILLQTDQMRPFSDIAGRDISLFSGEDDDEVRLINRLSSIGCKINGAISTQLVTKEQGSQVMEIETDPRNVFVVHGRNEHIQKELFSFLKMLGLFPIPWGDAVSATNTSAPYTGRIVEALLKKAQAVVVLLTEDDELQIISDNIIRQVAISNKSIYLPRPNVVFEAGMALSSTRLAERTILVQHGNVRLWDAIEGRHRIKLSDTIAHRQDLAKSLRDAGCPISIPSVKLFRQIGNFGI